MTPETRQWFSRSVTTLLLSLCLGLSTACASTPAEPEGTAAQSDLGAPSIERFARDLVAMLEEADYEALSRHVHPARGLVFSPYGHVDLTSAVHLSREEVARLGKDALPRTWGTADGTGDPIRLTFADYAERYVYDRDYAEAPQVAVDQRLGQGNTLHNLEDAFPGSAFVEFHFPGEDPQYGGMDWRSLRLVFEELGNRWWLIGVVHDEWTI
jgi:hypothetical protein